MKLRSVILGLCLVEVILLAQYLACQNGPTVHEVDLSWVQSTSTVTFNCVYRGTVTHVYTMPALYCSPTGQPIVAYRDNTVGQGLTYFYAVTAHDATSESAYSNEVQAVIPRSPNPPTALATPLVAQVKPKRSTSADGKLVALVH